LDAFHPDIPYLHERGCVAILGSQEGSASKRSLKNAALDYKLHNAA